jgi:hypothetical protein
VTVLATLDISDDLDEVINFTPDFMTEFTWCLVS